MATLNKKIRIVNSAGITKTANIYSTVAECGSPATLRVQADGTSGYVPLFYPDDIRSTSGRVWIPSNNTTYVIGSTGQPLYSNVQYTSPGTYTFTVPPGCVKVRITCVGGGGGASLGGLAYMATCGYAIGGKGGVSGVTNVINADGGNGGVTKQYFKNDNGTLAESMPPDYIAPTYEGSQGEGDG